MPVRRRPAVPVESAKPEPPPLASPKTVAPPTPTTPATGSLFLNGKQVQERLLISPHELREMVRARMLIPVPYLRGRTKPWRFARDYVDAVAQRQIADALGGAG
jgi:hypothetical protein